MTQVASASSAVPFVRRRSPTPVMVSVGATLPSRVIVSGSDVQVVTYSDPDWELARLAHRAMAEPGGRDWSVVKQALGL